MPTRHRPTAAAASSSKARRTNGEDDIGGEESLEVPSSKEKLKYFQAKRNRWNAARLQFLHRPPIVVSDAASSSPPHEATNAAQQRLANSRDGSSRAGNHGDKLTKQPFKGLPSLSWSSDSASYPAGSTSSFASSAVPATGARNRSTKEGVDNRPSGNQEREMISPKAGATVDPTTMAYDNDDDDGSVPAMATKAPSLSYREQVVQFYAKHNPSKVDSVNVLLERYEGREDQLLQKLKDKYETGGGGSLSSPKKAYPLPPRSGSVRCFLKFSSHPSHRVVVELFDEQVPATVENFRQLCLRQSAPQGYKQSVVHRIVPNFCVQMGDYTNGDGTGGRSIYTKGANDRAAQCGLSVDLWGNFQDEACLQHSEAGLLSMANNGPNKNSSQFFVTLKPLPHLDGKHVVFGRVLEGFESVIEPLAQTTVTDEKQRPLVETIRILDCGQIVDGCEVRTEEEMTQLSSTANNHAAETTIPSTTDAGVSFGASSSALPSPFGAAFGFGTSTTPLSISTAAATSPFSFAALSATAAAAAPASFSFAALSAAATSVVNTSSCDAFASFRGVTDDAMAASASQLIADTTQATATSASFDEATSRTADEQAAVASNTNGDDLQHPVSSFAVRSDPPNRGSITTTTTTASAAQLWSTPSVPFSFSPSSTITTVDPFSFASSRSTSTVGVGTRAAAAAARANAGERRAYIESEDGDSEEDEDDDEYVPEDDEEEESYSDETPSTCSEASDDDDDDDDDDAVTADSFRMQAPTTTTSTFSDVVPAPHSGAVSGAASSPSSTFSFAPPTVFGGAAPSAAATSTNRSGFPTASLEGAAPSQAASPLAAVEVNHSQPKSPTMLFGNAAPSPQKSAASSASEPVSDRTLMGACDANVAAKTAPFSQGFGFGSGGVGFVFGSSMAATLSFAGIASTGAIPAFGTPTMFPGESAASAKASILQTPPTSNGKSARGLSFTELRQTSNDAHVKRAGLDDDDDDDYDNDESSGTPSSSRSESPADGSLKQEGWEPAVSGLLSRGCLSTATKTISIDGVPKDRGESIDNDLPVSTDVDDDDADQVADALVLSGLDSNDDLTSPAEFESFGGALVELASSSADCELNDYTADGGNVDCEPPNVYSISFSTYDSATFIVPSFSKEEKPSVRKERQSETRTEDLLDCSSEINDIPAPKVKETFESEVNDSREPAKLSPDVPTCGLCWCLKSDSIGAVPPSVAGASDIEPTEPMPAVDLSPNSEDAAPREKNDSLANGPNGEVISNPDDDTLPAAASEVFRPTASPRSPGVGDPTMSTDSEKDYVPESLRRLVKEASLAIREGQMSFLTSVKEDLSLEDKLTHGHVVCTDENDHPSKLSLPEEQNTTSTASSMMYLLPSLVASEAPTERTRSLAIRTPRFQVLGGDGLAKKVKVEAKAEAVPVRLPFVRLSALPPPFDAALESTYTALLLQHRIASRCEMPLSIVKHEPICETTGGEAVNATPESPQRSVVEHQDGKKSTEESQPYFFGSSGPAASAFYFGHSASPQEVPSSGSWYTAGTSSPPRQSTSVSSPGLVGASCSSSSTAAIGTAPAPAGASTTANGEGGNAAGPAAFVFGAGIKPVVFNFEDREAREATYARYLGGGGGGEVALSEEGTSRIEDTKDKVK